MFRHLRGRHKVGPHGQALCVHEPGFPGKRKHCSLGSCAPLTEDRRATKGTRILVPNRVPFVFLCHSMETKKYDPTVVPTRLLRTDTNNAKQEQSAREKSGGCHASGHGGARHTRARGIGHQSTSAAARGNGSLSEAQRRGRSSLGPPAWCGRPVILTREQVAVGAGVASFRHRFTRKWTGPFASVQMLQGRAPILNASATT